MSSTPPGWYPDAQGTTRWFDGTNWTEHTQPSQPPAGAPAAPAAPAQGIPGQGAPYGGGGSWSPSGPGAPSGGGYPGGAGGYGGPMAPQPKKGPGAGLIVGLGILGLVLVAGIITAVVLLTKGGSSDNSASDTGGTSATHTSSPSPSSSSSDPSLGGTSTTQADPGTTSGDAPEQVAQEWVQAIVDGDCKKAAQYTVAAGSSSALCSDSTVPSGAGGSLKVKVESGTVNGSTATVPVKIVPDLPPGSGVDESTLPTLKVELEQQDDGSWLVSDATSS